MSIKIMEWSGHMLDGRRSTGRCLTIEIGRFTLDIAWGWAA